MMRLGVVRQNEIALVEPRLVSVVREHAATTKMQDEGEAPLARAVDMRARALDVRRVVAHACELHWAQDTGPELAFEALAAHRIERDLCEVRGIDLVPVTRAAARWHARGAVHVHRPPSC